MKFALGPVLYMAMTDPTKPPASTPTKGGVPRQPTVRSFTLPATTSPRNKSLQARTDAMNALHSAGAPLSTEELEDIIHSLQNIYPRDVPPHLDWDELKSCLLDVAHLSHKDWTVTETNAERLGDLLFPTGVHDSSAARQFLERILVEGHWDAAVDHAAAMPGEPPARPWAVLVTGVNGIRKTTSLYQDWWPQLLSEALVAPDTTATVDNTKVGDKRKHSAATTPELFPLESLPSGHNSFFRQLDHLIATLCNEDFKALYWLTQQSMRKDADPSPAMIQQYSNLKAAIFSRYRTLSELLGARLLLEGQRLRGNCLMETSGRDVAMFHYVDHMFHNNKDDHQVPYHKLALHFTINDLTQAQASVDRRMVQEIQAGVAALEAEDDVAIIHANAGGPYGSEVLPGVQEASDAVWETIVRPQRDDDDVERVGQDWYKATIAIHAYADQPWTAQAVKPDGSLGTEFTFAPPK